MKKDKLTPGDTYDSPGGQGYARRTPQTGVARTQKANSHGGGVGAHPGATDRMVGNSKSAETGPSHPAYLPRKRGKR